MHHVFITMDVVVLNSVFSFMFDVVEQLIILMVDRVLQGSTLVVGHVVAVDVTRVVAVGVNVMSKVLANMVVVVVIKDVITLEGVLGHPLVKIMMNFVCFGFMLPIIWIMFDSVNIVALINVLGVVLAVIYL